MQPLSVVGPEADAVVRSLVRGLDGRIATIRRVESESSGTVTETTDSTFSGTADSEREIGDGGKPAQGFAEKEERPDESHHESAVATTLDLDRDGTWHGSGTGRTFTDLLSSLAPDHDYVLAAGFSRLRVPTVVLTGEDEPTAGSVDPEIAGEVVATAPTADDIDVPSLIDEMDGFEPFVTLEELVSDAKESPMADRAGAIGTFTGRVRMKDAPDDDPTEQLEFEKYEGVAEKRMEEISEELEQRDEIFEVLMHHRTGVIEAGEDIVFVVVLAGHRKQAFRTVEDGIDMLKDDVPIFKKEATVSDEFWVHQRE